MVSLCNSAIKGQMKMIVFATVQIIYDYHPIQHQILSQVVPHCNYISCNPRHVPQSLPKSSMFILSCKLFIRYWFRLHKLIAIVTVNIIGPGGIDDENNNESSVKSDDPNRKGIQDESGFYDDDDRILSDNHKLINSMKFDDIKLETYDRVFNRSFTNPIGYKFNGKSLAHKS